MVNKALLWNNFILRLAKGLFKMVRGQTKALGVTHLLSYKDGEIFGPIQQPEALLLYSLVKTTTPRVIVEFGFSGGHSAFNFLQAADESAILISYDTSETARKWAEELFHNEKRFTFVHKSQADFSKEDLPKQKTIDMVFFDGAHEFETNKITFLKILPFLDEDGIVIVHDTGMYPGEAMSQKLKEKCMRESPQKWKDGFYIHQPDERQFVNWIIKEFPEFHAINLHSSRCVRHGLSLLQRHKELSV